MFLNIFLDIVLVAILIGGSSYGYSKGLFKMTVGPAKMIVSIVLSLNYCGVIGRIIVEPALQEVFMDSGTPIFESFVDVFSTAVAFGILFLITKTLSSFLISLINQLMEKGIVGRINSAMGLVFAGSIAFLTAISIATFSEYLLQQDVLSDIEAFSDFSGGPLYRFFTLISPGGLLYTN